MTEAQALRADAQTHPTEPQTPAIEAETHPNEAHPNEALAHPNEAHPNEALALPNEAHPNEALALPNEAHPNEALALTAEAQLALPNEALALTAEAQLALPTEPLALTTEAQLALPTEPLALSPRAQALAPARPAAAARPAPAAPARSAPAVAARPAPAAAAPARPAATRAAPALETPAPVDLSEVEALSDLPDDSRDAFARAATIEELVREDEVSGFALALVLEGSVDVAATIIDAPAERLGAGAVLRSRGTIEQVAPLRLLAASDKARIATWDDAAVAEAFRSCPWVEDELRASGDRLQALVGLTMGPLGERLDPMLRNDVTRRLQLKTLADHEVFVTRGAPGPGLVVVGAGELELVAQNGKPTGQVVRTGEFLFPTEVLMAAPAPFTARATEGGALLLVADRGTAQELLVTCPPLLEIFAGG